MARVLILFGTTDGQTHKIAGVMATQLRELGHEVDVWNAGKVPAAIRAEHYDGVIVAASVHAGGYQRDVRRWVAAHAPALAHRPTAFVSVCLGILDKDPAVRQQLDAIIRQFEQEVHWKPGAVKIVAGALLYTKYGWLKRWTMKRIVAKGGGDTDTSRDYEYTDWDDVRAFAREFVTVHLTPAAPIAVAVCPHCKPMLPVAVKG